MVREGLADRDDADADYVPVIESDDEEEVSIGDDAPVAAKKGVNRKRGRPRKILRVGAPTKQAAHEKASSSNSSVNAIYLLEAQKKLQLKSKQTDLKFSLAASKPFTSWVHLHWKSQNSLEYGSEVTSKNFNALQSAKPVMVCNYREKVMAWNPSTDREKHLRLHCKKFAATEHFTTPEVQRDLETYRKLAASKNARLFDFQIY
jgi:hypothetical protein